MVAANADIGGVEFFSGNPRLTEVEDVHDGVKEAVEKNQDARELVQVDVVVQRQESAESSRPQESDALSQHQDQDEHAVEIQALSWKCPR